MTSLEEPHRHSPTETPILKVVAGEAATCLRPLRKNFPKYERTATLSFSDERMEVRCDIYSISVPATGVWPCVAEIKRKDVLDLSRWLDRLQPDREIDIVGLEGQIRVASSFFPCKWRNRDKA